MDRSDIEKVINILDNIPSIENILRQNNFNYLYSKIKVENYSFVSNFFISELNIDVAKYLSVIPSGFLGRASSDVKGLIIPDTCRKVKRQAVWHSSIKSLKIDSPNIQLEEDCFSYNDQLTTVYLPEGLKFIPAEAFRECSSLTRINIPDSVKFIGSRAFEGCQNIQIFMNRREALNPLKFNTTDREFLKQHIVFN